MNSVQKTHVFSSSYPTSIRVSSIFCSSEWYNSALLIAKYERVDDRKNTGQHANLLWTAKQYSQPGNEKSISGSLVHRLQTWNFLWSIKCFDISDSLWSRPHLHEVPPTLCGSETSTQVLLITAAVCPCPPMPQWTLLRAVCNKDLYGEFYLYTRLSATDWFQYAFF
jgi:hypothetical protein